MASDEEIDRLVARHMPGSDPAYLASEQARMKKMVRSFSKPGKPMTAADVAETLRLVGLAAHYD